MTQKTFLLGTLLLIIGQTQGAAAPVASNGPARPDVAFLRDLHPDRVDFVVHPGSEITPANNCINDGSAVAAIHLLLSPQPLLKQSLFMGQYHVTMHRSASGQVTILTMRHLISGIVRHAEYNVNIEQLIIKGRR